MKKKMPYVLAGILLMISLMCMACGSTQEATALPDDANESIQDEEDEDLQNDPNDGLGGDLNEDTVMISAALRVSGWEKRTTITITWSLIARGTGPFT